MTFQAQFTPHQQSSQFFVPDQQQHLNQDVVQGPEADAGAVPDAVPNNAGLVMNAGAAAAGQIQEVPADRQRDLLDWVYVMTRLMFLISVIYFHSSFIRLAFVAGLGFAVYLYQNRIRQAKLVTRSIFIIVSYFEMFLHKSERGENGNRVKRYIGSLYKLSRSTVY